MEKSIRKIMIVSAGNIAPGGVVNFLINEVEHLENKRDYSFSWFCPGEILDNNTEKRIGELGIKIVSGNIRIGQEKDYRKWRKMYSSLKKCIMLEKPDIIHINTGNRVAQFLSLYLGKKGHVPVRIAHSHGAYIEPTDILRKVYHWILRKGINRLASIKLTCSDLAGISLFGPNVSYETIYNGIDTIKYRFSEINRKAIRDELQLNNKLVIGHVGNFDTNKNQVFLIQMLEKLLEDNDNYRLLLIGDGEKREFLEEKVKNSKLSGKALFLGVQNNVNEWLSAMDVFVLPSEREGLPLSCIEAQCSGLPCILSKNISAEVAITELVSFADIETQKTWINTIGTIVPIKDREQYSIRVKEKGYDITDSVRSIEKHYR